MLWRLGVRARGEESDQQLVEAMAEALSKTGIGIDRFFFDWFGGHRHGPGPEDAGYDRPELTDFIARLSSYAPRLGSTPDYFRDADPCSMRPEQRREGTGSCRACRFRGSALH